MVGEQFWCRATHQTIELYNKGKRITSHVRSFVKYGYSTHPEHRPASHRAHLEWTPSRLINWGKKIGPHTAAVVEHVLNSKPHSEQGYRSTLGLLRLSNRFGTGRLEKACERSIAIGSANYRSVKMILKRRMEAAPLPDQAQDSDATAGARRCERGCRSAYKSTTCSACPSPNQSIHGTFLAHRRRHPLKRPALLEYCT